MKSRMVIAAVFSIIVSLFVFGCGLGTITGPAPEPSPTGTEAAPPTITATAIPSDTPTVTPVPIPTITLTHWDGVYNGPDFDYGLSDFPSGDYMVYVLSKSTGKWGGGCFWYKIQIPDTDKTGWIQCGPSTKSLNDDAIPYDTGELLPTLTPKPTPILPRTVRITIVNETKYEVQADFYGPYEVHLTIPAGATRVANLPAGFYDYSVSSPGIVPLSGNGDWKDGYSDTWHITAK